jgi:MerR family copper efflux transcriptional regulator
MSAHTLRERGRVAHFIRAILDTKLLESVSMRITEAARRLGTSARMLRYREDLGLLPQVRDPLPWPPPRPGAAVRADGPDGRPDAAVRADGPDGRPDAAVRADGPHGPADGPPGPADGPHGSAHRQFSEADLEAVAVALELERRYDISPASLAFGLRVLAEPPVRAAVADLGRRLGRIPATPGRALDFEKERALRLLSRG